MIENSKKMEAAIETSFYPDEGYMNKEKMRNLKRTMTLDLDNPVRNGVGVGGGGIGNISKKQKFSCLLSSPDLNMLKLGSPELENLIIQQNGQVLTTPTPTQFIFPKNVTEEQEMYARGFDLALAELHASNPAITSGQEPVAEVGSEAPGTVIYTSFPQAMAHAGLTVSLAGPTATSSCPMGIPPYTTSTTTTTTAPSTVVDVPVSSSASYLPVVIKEEPQIVPNSCSTPPLSPIDMMAQEMIKLERKRQRNRVAASKCRRRKLERIARLEDKVKLLKSENTELGCVVSKLKDHICGLKQQLMEHVTSGCQILTPSQYLS